jgi:tight adherence protein B
MDPMVIVSATFGLGILAMFWGLLRLIYSQSVPLDERLGAEYGLDASSQERARPGGRKPRQLNRLVSGTARERILNDLARADLKLTPGEYVAGQIATTFLGLIIGYVIFRGNLLPAVLGGAVGLYFPRWYVRHLQQKRLIAFDNQLPDAILLISNALRSGYSLLQSLDTVAKEVGQPMAGEFARVTREVGLGLTLNEALDNLLLRMPSDDLNMFVMAVNIQNEVGGNLAEILEIIAKTIRERVRVLGEIRTITAQQRLSARVLALLPLGLGLIMYVLNPGYVSQLWENSCGLVMIATGALMSVTGYLVIRRVAAIEV